MSRMDKPAKVAVLFVLTLVCLIGMVVGESLEMDGTQVICGGGFISSGIATLCAIFQD